MAYKLNPFTKKLDYYDADRFTENGDTLELNWNGVLVHSWTATPAGGYPMGWLFYGGISNS